MVLGLFRKGKDDDPTPLAAAISAVTLNQITSGALYWDLQNGKEYTTPAMVAMLPQSSNPDIPAYSRLLQLFDAPNKESLDSHVRELRKSGKKFAVAVRAETGKIYQISGYRAEDPTVQSMDGSSRTLADVICLIDQTDLRSQLAELEERSLQIEKRRELMRTMINSVPVPIWVRSRDGNLVLVNLAYERAMGVKPDVRIPEIAAGLAGQDGKDLGEAVIKTGEAATIKGHLILSGQRRYVEVLELPLKNSGDFVSVGYIRDLNDQFELEGQVQRLEKGHQQVLETMATAIGIYGTDKRLTFYNSAFVDIWQLDEAFLKTSPTLSAIYDKLRENRLLPEVSDFPKFKEERNQLFTSLLETKEELQHLPDGRTFRIIVSPHPQGGLLFFHEDVSEKMDLTSSVNTLLEVQKETLDNLYEGVAVYGSDGRLKLSNPTYRKQWTLPEGEEEPHLSDVLELNQNLFPHANGDWPTLKKHLITLYTDRMAREGRLERTDEQILDYAVVPLPDGASLLSYLDITDQFRVETVLRERNDALEAADKLKSEFIANVSYGLRTPLNTIRGFAEILNNKYFGELNDKQGEYMGDILTASEELMGLIDDILDLATIEAGYMTLQYTTFDLGETIAGVISSLDKRANAKNLEIIRQLPETMGAIEADEKRLRQAIFNILLNAVQHTADGGKITVNAEETEDTVVLTIIDSGVGIPADQQATIFEKFSKGENPTRRSGIGLGLSLVKSFMDLHDGQIDLASEPGNGTTVTLRIPKKPANKELVEKAKKELEDHPGLEASGSQSF